jgi:hypothetical protein
LPSPWVTEHPIKNARSLRDPGPDPVFPRFQLDSSEDRTPNGEQRTQVPRQRPGVPTLWPLWLAVLVFDFDHPVVYNTVFNHETIETLARDRSPVQVRRALRERGITHVYVDWPEIARYRAPGNYGFTPFVTPELFAGLVNAGVLEPPVPIGEAQRLYRVR